MWLLKKKRFSGKAYVMQNFFQVKKSNFAKFLAMIEFRVEVRYTSLPANSIVSEW